MGIIILSFAAGFLVCGVVVFVMMPRMMIVVKESRYDVEETVSKLTQAIEDAGWTVSQVSDMNAAMAKQDVAFVPKVQLVKLCKAGYAVKVLQDSRHIGCLMPCSIAVYEGDDGKTYLSEMNIGLMAKMFGGTIKKVMGGDVVRDEHKMLSGIVKN